MKMGKNREEEKRIKTRHDKLRAEKAQALMGRYEETRIIGLEGNVMKLPDHQNISAV